MCAMLINKYKDEAVSNNREKLQRVQQAIQGTSMVPDSYRYQFLTALQSQLGYPEEFVASYKQYIQGLENNYLGLMDSLDDETAKLDNYRVFVLGDSFYANDIRYCLIHPDEEVIVSNAGIDYNPDDVLKAMGDNLAASHANLAFLETIIQTQDSDSVSDKVSLLKNKLELVNGSITSTNADYYDYLSSVITNSEDNKTALLTWMVDQQCTEVVDENTGEAVGFRSNVEGLTGKNPLLTLMSGLEIPVDTILGGLGQVVLYTIGGLGLIVWSIVKSVLVIAAKGVLKIFGWIVDKFINPTDITTTQDETGDPVLLDLPSVITIKNNSFTTANGRTAFALLYSKLNEHPGEFMRLFTLGATFYIGANSSDKSITVYTYKHLYDYTTANHFLNMIRSGASGNLDTDTTASLLKKFLPLIDYSNVDDDVEEVNVFKGYITSNKLIEFGVYAMDTTEDDGWRKYYNNIMTNPDFGSYGYHTFCGYNGVSMEDIYRPTNSQWASEAKFNTFSNEGDDLDDTIILKLLEVCKNLLDNDPSLSGMYMPYTWTTGAVPSRFKIKSNSENATDAANALVTIAVTAVVITAVVVGLKVRKNINAKSLAYQRQAYNAASDPNITDAQYKKIVKKSKRYAKLSGKSYMDVVPSEPVSDSSDRILSLLR